MILRVLKDKKNMSIMNKKIAGTIYAVFISIMAFAQPGWNYEGLTPEQQEKAQTYMVTMGDDVKAKKYADGLPKVEWLLENSPKIHKSLYINGAKVYEGMVKTSTDKAKIDEYEDKALMMYDKRIEYFGGEANVLNRKGQKAWVYWKDRAEKTEELYNLYNKIHQLNGSKMYAPNTVAYMDMSCKMKKEGKLNDDQVMEAYDKISDVLNANAGVEKYEKMRESVDGMLASCVTVDCGFVKENLEPKFKSEPEIKLAKKMFSLMSSGGCSDDPVFFELMEYIDSKEPSFGMKITMARKAKNANDLDRSLDYYNKALEVAPDEKKAEIYYDMAYIYKKKGDKVTARSYARKSIAAGSSNKSDAYELIGDLYMASFKECANTSLVNSRCVYIAAYNQYKMAGNSKKMAGAKAQFPSMEEIFTENKVVGGEETVKCWINETVKIDKR